MSGLVFGLLRRFRRETRGVVLILFVLLFVPLLLVIAVGIDFGQSLFVKRQLAGAVDSAALALGRLPQITDQAELEAKAESYIRARYPTSSIGELTGFTANRTNLANGDVQIDVTATANVPTPLMGIGGVDSLTVNVDTRVLFQEKFLDLALVLDNSGSIGNGGKLQAMKDASTILVNALFGPQATSPRVRVGLVPFTGAVNVNVPEDTFWLDRNNPAPLHTQRLNLAAGESAFNFLEVMNGGIAANWGGCVRSRFNAGVDDLDTTDTPPDPLIAETLFSAYFNPFNGPDKDSYQGLTAAPNDDNDSPNFRCPVTPVQPLTNVKSTIITAIDAMTADGPTNIPAGLAWGLRLVSPGEPFTEGGAYTDPKNLKAIILLTDGNNDIDGSYSSYGFDGTDNPQVGSDPNDSLDTRTAQLCNNIKADKDGDTSDEDIIIFSIIFDVSSGSIITLMENCASGTDRFFNSPDGATLQRDFEEIAASLIKLRLVE